MQVKFISVDTNSYFFHRLAEALEKMITNSEARTKMKQNLSGIDYSSEKTRYFNDWCKLLEA